MLTLKLSDKVAVIGAGTMGAGIAQVAAMAGHAVILLDIVDGAADQGIETIKSGLNKLVVKNKKTPEEVGQIINKITPAQDLTTIKDCRLVIEAIVEQLDVKRSLISDIENTVTPDTIIASNTSSISISALAANALRPENIVGMHFFNPAVILKLVEVVSGLQTSDATTKTVANTAAAWGKKPVFAKSSPGFIVNRVARPFYAEALRSLTEQLGSVDTIDALMRSCGGFKMGPLELTDLIGQDVNCAVTESVYNAFFQDKRFMPSVLQAEMVAAGLLGQKSGRGFYTYPRTIKDRETEAFGLTAQVDNVQVIGGFEQAAGLHECLNEYGYSPPATGVGELHIVVGEATIKQSDGRTATQRAADEGITNLVLLDYAQNYKSATDIALAIGVNTSGQAKSDAARFFQSLGKEPHVIRDLPGMQVLRTVCMLINEASDTVHQGVCNAADLDAAMLDGVAYPLGPIAWGHRIGVKRVCQILSNIKQAYGEERYRVSPLLAALAHESIS